MTEFADHLIVTKLGYFNPWLFFGSAMTAIAGGLFSTFHLDTDSGKWIGYQIFLGAGAGTAIQMPTIAVMAVLPKADVSIGTAISTFSQFLGGAIFLAISQNIFVSRLVKELTIHVPEVDPHMIVRAGATAIRRVVADQSLEGVLEAYNTAITSVFVSVTI
jgi:hypothetical protein